MHITEPGEKWSAWIEQGIIYVAQMSSEPATWGTAVEVDSSGNYDAVRIGVDMGRIYLLARRTSTQKLYEWYSNDWGRTWTGPSLVGA